MIVNDDVPFPSLSIRSQRISLAARKKESASTCPGPPRVMAGGANRSTATMANLASDSCEEGGRRREFADCLIDIDRHGFDPPPALYEWQPALNTDHAFLVRKCALRVEAWRRIPPRPGLPSTGRPREKPLRPAAPPSARTFRPTRNSCMEFLRSGLRPTISITSQFGNSFPQPSSGHRR